MASNSASALGPSNGSSFMSKSPPNPAGVSSLGVGAAAGPPANPNSSNNLNSSTGATQSFQPSPLAARNEEIWFHIGNLAEAMNEPEKALAAYESALRQNPNSVAALAQIGSLYRSKDQCRRAIEFFERALALDPSNGEIWGALGHCCLRIDELESAFNAYQQALNYLPNPKEPKLWYGIGILYDKFGSLEEAEEAFTVVMQMDPNFDKANEIYFRLGIIYKQQGKYTLSLDCFRYILSCPPSPLTEMDVWLQMGQVYEQQREFNLAREAYERILHENPNHAKVLQQLGWLYQQQHPGHNPDLAIAYLTHSLEIDKSDAQTHYFLGRCYMAQQKYSKAYDAYQQAVFRDSKNPIFWCSIGVLYYQLTQYRDALDAYSRAIQLNPGISAVWYDLGTLYETCNNQIPDAIDAYTRALELDPGNQQIKQRLQLLRGQGAHSLGPGSQPAPQDPAYHSHNSSSSYFHGQPTTIVSSFSTVPATRPSTQDQRVAPSAVQKRPLYYDNSAPKSPPVSNVTARGDVYQQEWKKAAKVETEYSKGNGVDQGQANFVRHTEQKEPVGGKTSQNDPVVVSRMSSQTEPGLNSRLSSRSSDWTEREPIPEQAVGLSTGAPPPDASSNMPPPGADVRPPGFAQSTPFQQQQVAVTSGINASTPQTGAPAGTAADDENLDLDLDLSGMRGGESASHNGSRHATAAADAANGFSSHSPTRAGGPPGHASGEASAVSSVATLAALAMRRQMDEDYDDAKDSPDSMAGAASSERPAVVATAESAKGSDRMEEEEEEEEEGGGMVLPVSQ
ncbi:hypothetical protein DFJ73DRAFT_842623 [Zopfochytrium polystomum]|nr:hypothetical protein DFJ73DRAFT_842623 [Zopfochytrium polystomum]